MGWVQSNSFLPFATPLEEDSNISAISEPLAGLQAASLKKRKYIHNHNLLNYLEIVPQVSIPVMIKC